MVNKQHHFNTRQFLFLDIGGREGDPDPVDELGDLEAEQTLLLHRVEGGGFARSNLKVIMKFFFNGTLHIRKNTQKSKFLFSQAFKWKNRSEIFFKDIITV